MKIFALTGPDSWYMMAESNLGRHNNPFFVPDFDTEFLAFPALCLRVGKLGKGVAPRFAMRYVDAWSVVAPVVAPNLLESLRTRRLPWTRAVSFDRSCLVGNFQPISSLHNYATFSALCGQQSLTGLRLPPPGRLEEMVAVASAENTIKHGDLVIERISDTGLPLLPGTRLKIDALAASDSGCEPFDPEPLNVLDIKIR